jgi:hypothetical protein
LKKGCHCDTNSNKPFVCYITHQISELKLELIILRRPLLIQISLKIVSIVRRQPTGSHCLTRQDSYVALLQQVAATAGPAAWGMST